MAFERPQNHHHLVIAVFGVALAFGASAVAGQMVFRQRFGPPAAAASPIPRSSGNEMAVALPTTEQAKQQVQASLDEAANRAGQAVQAAAQHEWDKAKSNTAAALLEATVAGEKTATAPITDLKSPEAKQQAQAVGAASVSLWQTLAEVFATLWHGLVGLFKK